MAKIAWVLGGGSGIGAETVKQLSKRGWTVAISGRRESPLNALSASHGARPYPLDVTDVDAVKATIGKIVGDLGKIDLMIFSVAAWEPGKPGQYDYESYAKVIDTNLLGAMRVLDPLIAQMRKQGFGEIALVASVAGYFGLPRSAAYSSGKSAMITLAETMHTELARDNIAVRLICPGFVKTDLTAKNDFPMPFLMEAEDAGKAIADGLLNTTKFEIAFPLPFVLILKALRFLPYPIFFALMKRLIADDKQN
ncbi:SDR family NAD(P)-dependent oxidoreductase [Pelagibacterium luteolum]|uniref:Short-chain dehydrogenase n=1 Tax=Pelagibacterium luteolum TaxID=440168 RepID=A0A1G7WDK2_9HYPH|nr:SDR family NAD(P)-dependent oxidoreductase [Pelagibacterium luteolum]SDG70072.1 Short-chain dehydrogenase [Pelagibacterium luteolum]